MGRTNQTRGAPHQRALTKINKQMKKALLFLAMLIAGLLIGGSFDAQTAELQSQPNHISK